MRQRQRSLRATEPTAPIEPLLAEALQEEASSGINLAADCGSGPTSSSSPKHSRGERRTQARKGSRPSEQPDAPDSAGERLVDPARLYYKPRYVSSVPLALASSQRVL